MRNAVYAIIIAVCLTTAGVTVFATRSAGRNLGVPNSQQTWVKCMSCGDARQMSLKNYWKQLRARMSKENGAANLTCPKCGKDTIVEAFKCPKCGEISPRRNAGPGGFDDRCPKCGFSQLEADANARAEKKTM
jgi:predicted RNA-binding Zn-ribbon protein involved in translation (DUF1610 family)